MREVANTIFYVVGSSCQWLALPKNFPPVSVVRDDVYSWRDTGVWPTINQIIAAATRELKVREATPTAGVINSQAVTIRQSGSIPGYYADKKIKGRKRHVYAEGGYTGGQLSTALIGCCTWTIEIIKHSEAANGFHVLRV